MRPLLFSSGNEAIRRRARAACREGRVFPFTTELRRVLEDQRVVADQLQKDKGIITRYVFFYTAGKKTGQRITESGFNKAWRKTRVAAGCPGRLPHDFRRTAVDMDWGDYRGAR
jgi:integrase